jgi:hypothetical protein
MQRDRSRTVLSAINCIIIAYHAGSTKRSFGVCEDREEIRELQAWLFSSSIHAPFHTVIIQGLIAPDLPLLLRFSFSFIYFFFFFVAFFFVAFFFYFYFFFCGCCCCC